VRRLGQLCWERPYRQAQIVLLKRPAPVNQLRAT
jgi:hypothetical protein